MNISEAQVFAEQLIISSLYCLFISGMLYSLVALISRKTHHLTAWRGVWFMLLICSLLPTLFGFLPSPVTELTPVVIYELKENLVSHTPLNSVSHIIESNAQALWFSYSVLASAILILIISTGLMLKNIIKWFAVKRLIEQATPIDVFFQQSIYGSKNQKRLLKRLIYFSKSTPHSTLSIKVSEQVQSPFVTGFFNPVLIVTPTAFKELDSLQFNLMIRHELMHLKRHDPTLLFIAQLLKSIFWFNPFIKQIVHQLNWAIELSCDDLVLQRRPNLRRIYALAMLTILRRSATQPFDKPVAAFSSTPQRSFTMRIKLIMNPKSKRIKRSIKHLGLTSASLGIISASFLFQPALLAQSIPGDNFKATAVDTMINPVATARVTSNYGANNKLHKFHKGIDLADKRGTSVVASAAGTVVISTDLLKDKKNYGKIIVLDHGNGLQSLYSHLDQRQVTEGDRVQAGQQIGQVGATGKTTGPHLHFELRKNNKPIDPNQYIAFKQQ